MMNIIVLGSGLVGAPMAMDLSRDPDFSVTAVDVNPDSLSRIPDDYLVKKNVKDLKDPAIIADLVSQADIVLNAVPGFIGFQTLKAIIEAGKNVVDIAFFPEDMFELDTLAREKNVIVISDMGVAPGMSNVLIGYADHILDQTERARIYVGGLPRIRTWPYEYKAVFSPVDVIEEYTRPARYIVNGNLVVKPALSDSELLDFPGIGTLEAFNSDGLRSLIRTINAPDMIEKTLRYKGHIEKMMVLRETGFFSQEKISIGGTMISPMEFTARILFPKWKLQEGEEDLTIMQVIVEGNKSGKKLRYTYDLLDYYDVQTGVHSMARTTGYAATMAVRMIARGLYSQIGVSAPEFIGRYPECVSFLLNGMKERGIVYHETVREI